MSYLHVSFTVKIYFSELGLCVPLVSIHILHSFFTHPPETVRHKILNCIA